MMAKPRRHPTDRGWAWVILAASLGSHFMNGALTYSVGVLHTGLLKQFQPDTVSFLALTGAVYSSLVCLSAPLASVIVNRYGCRTCCVLGGLLCFAGYTSSAFVTSVSVLLFTYGVTAGLGLGFTYSATNITIGFYFERLRGLASGISNSMQAVGILSGSVIFQALMDAYGVSGMFLLLGAASLHFCFFGMFFRPSIYEGKSYELAVELEEKQGAENQPDDLDVSLGATLDTSLDLPTNDDGLNAEEKESISLLKENSCNDVAQTDVISGASPKPETDCELKDSVIDLDVASGEGCRADDVLVDEQIHNDAYLEMETVVSENARVTADGANFEVECPNSTSVPLLTSNSSDCPNSSSVPLLSSNNLHEPENDTPLTETRTFKNAYLVLSSDSINTSVSQPPSECASNPASRERRQHPSSKKNALASTRKTEGLFVSCASSINAAEKRIRNAKERKRKWGYCANYMVLLCNKAFMLHCASLFVSNIHVAGVFLHLPEYAQIHGTTPIQAAELFVAVGSFSLLSKLSSGFATADPEIDALILSVGMMGLNGIVTCLFPLYADSFSKQMVFSSLFGLYFGGLYALINPILVRFAGVALLADAYGISMFILGLGYMTGPTLAAMIVDGGGTYSLSFLFLGIMMLSGAFLDMGAASFLQARNKETDDVIPPQDADWLEDGDADWAANQAYGKKHTST